MTCEFTNLEDAVVELRRMSEQFICPEDRFFGPLADAIEELHGRLKEIDSVYTAKVLRPDKVADRIPVRRFVISEREFVSFCHGAVVLKDDEQGAVQIVLGDIKLDKLKEAISEARQRAGRPEPEPAKQRIRVAIGETNFRFLCRGKTAYTYSFCRIPVEIVLQDIGFDRMLLAVKDAMGGVTETP